MIGIRHLWNLTSDNGTLFQRPSHHALPATIHILLHSAFLDPVVDTTAHILLIMDDRERERFRKLKENGTVDRLRQHLLAELLNDPGWMLAVRESVRESASQREGAELMDLTLEDMVAAIVPAGKEAVLTAVQERIMVMIQKAVRNAERKDYGKRDGL